MPHSILNFLITELFREKREQLVRLSLKPISTRDGGLTTNEGREIDMFKTQQQSNFLFQNSLYFNEFSPLGRVIGTCSVGKFPSKLLREVRVVLVSPVSIVS